MFYIYMLLLNLTLTPYSLGFIKKSGKGTEFLSQTLLF